MNGVRSRRKEKGVERYSLQKNEKEEEEAAAAAATTLFNETVQ